MLNTTPDKINATFEEYEDEYLNSNGRLDTTVYTTIAKYHNSIVGHHGVDATIRMMDKAQVPHWPHMRKHIAYFIKYSCPCCQKMSQIKPVINTRPFSTSAYRVMEVINIDLIGPMPPDRYGNEYVLVIRDAFSRWTDLTAIKSKEAEGIAQALLKFFGTFGWPTELRSDGGAEFVNSTIQALLDVVGTEHAITLAYSHEENGLVERANQEVLKHLRKLVFDTRLIAIWSDMLTLVQRIMNTQVVETIGVSPAQIIFGNAVDLDRNFVPMHIRTSDSVATERSYRTWMDTLIANQSLIVDITQKTLFNNVQKALRRNRKEEGITEFPLDSIVLAQYHDKGLGKRPPSKLHPKWEGPFRVVNISNYGNQYSSSTCCSKLALGAIWVG
jgi:hypothetical protein